MKSSTNRIHPPDMGLSRCRATSQDDGRALLPPAMKPPINSALHERMRWRSGTSGKQSHIDPASQRLRLVRGWSKLAYPIGVNRAKMSYPGDGKDDGGIRREYKTASMPPPPPRPRLAAEAVGCARQATQRE
jgi:hypothetical protein